MNALLGLFAKAHANKNLSPAARAILRLVEGLVITALISALPVVADALSSSRIINWADVGHTALIAGSAAVLAALLKYVKAHGDDPLAQVAEPLLAAAQKRVTSSASSATKDATKAK